MCILIPIIRKTDNDTIPKLSLTKGRANYIRPQTPKILNIQSFICALIA